MGTNKLGRNVRYYRELAGLTQSQLAALLDYESHSTVSKIESGDRDVPLDKLADFARVLHVSPLVFFNDPPEPDYSEYIKQIRHLEKTDPEKLRVIREMLGMECGKKRCAPN